MTLGNVPGVLGRAEDALAAMHQWLETGHPPAPVPVPVRSEGAA